jgi:hypothetical protein
MARDKTKAHQRYRSKTVFQKNGNGVILPGVTTIIDGQLGWNKRVLMNWATQTALDGIDPEAVKVQAGDIGTLIHDMIEAHIVGEEFDTSGSPQVEIDKAENGFLAFLDWEAKYKPQYLGLEIEVISERYMYGGTLDILMKLDEKLVQVDLKSSKGVYAEMIIQVAAYKQAYEEQENAIIDECHILKLGKDDGGFEHHKISEDKLAAGWRVFERLVEIKREQKVLK